MLTIFSVPKPFSDDTAMLQRLAILSWIALDCRIILVGDEHGIAEAAEALGVECIAGVTRNENGTPRLDSAFAEVDRIAPAGIRCFVNSDIILTADLPAAVDSARAYPQFLLIGQSRDLHTREAELADAERLRSRALHEGRLRGPTAIDWFVFSDHLFDPLPAFLVGRAAFDNWMVWKARQVGPVIDASDAVVAIHQPHDYGHLAGGKEEAYYGAEAEHNRSLAGGRRRIYTLHDASHRMRADLSIRRNFGATLRLRETVRKVGWKLGVH